MKKNKGFTLLEVLIASVILFSAIAIVAQMLNASAFTSIKATDIATKALFYDQIENLVVQEARKSLTPSIEPHIGAFQFDIYSVNWSATPIQSGKAYSSIFEDNTNPNTYTLYKLDISVESERTSNSWSLEALLW